MPYFKKLKRLHTSNFTVTGTKGETTISNKRNLHNEALRLCFTLLKIEIIQTGNKPYQKKIQNQLGEMLTGARDPCIVLKKNQFFVLNDYSNYRLR